ncbi:MAG: hypothetical protein ACOCUI_03535 [bacterium]
MKDNRWEFPLKKQMLGITKDSYSFKNIDISHYVELPYAPHVGAFGIERKFDVHKGIDLYANIDDSVYAVEDGVICLIRPFTGKKANCDWWLDTEAINIAGRSGIVVYGEILVNAATGNFIFAIGKELGLGLN